MLYCNQYQITVPIALYKEENMILDKTEEFVAETKKHLKAGDYVEYGVTANTYATLALVETLKQINETLKLLVPKETK